MVSIPDWSKFGRLGEVQKKVPSLGARYNRQKEAEAVKQAEESGYFLKVDRPFIEKHILCLDQEAEARRLRGKSFITDEEHEEVDLSGIQMVRLANARLRTVGDIGLCSYIRICILSNNYITRFDALVTCVHLIKLDLHSNQIQNVPPGAFWSSKPFLRIINLHDNPIGHIENLHHLASCANLSALTLYDTPLSLKRNYRHHVVNSIWSLKALDNHVVSDEEIIEDAEFDVRFAAMHPNFSISLCSRLNQAACYEDEVQSTIDILAEINIILAHNSPVLIIQRYIRGYLTRKRFRFVADTTTCKKPEGASIKAQQKMIGTDADMPPPPSPAEGQRVKPKATDGSFESSRLDYDTYMQHRRPGSIAMSETSTSRMETGPQSDQLKESIDTGVMNRIPGTPVSVDPGSQDGRTHIFINLAKLEQGTLQSLNDEAVAMDTAAFPPTEVTLSSRDDKLKLDLSARKIKKKKEADKKKKIIKSVRQFFGPVVEVSETPEPIEPMEEDEEEIPTVNFRLKGLKENVMIYDPMTEMIMSKQDAGRLVREAEYNIHKELEMRPDPVIENRSQPNAERRLFNRIQGTMGFSCLRAVEQAYKDRAKAEKQVSKLEHVLNMRDQREAAKERVKHYKDVKRDRSMKQREIETKRTAEVLEKRELQRLGYIYKSQELRTKSSNFQKHQRDELTFISDFNAQNTSVSNALLRHDRLARREDTLQEKSKFVQNHRLVEQDQQDIVKKYLEHRQLMRQTESALARATLDTRMLQEANDHLMQAKARVAHQKARSKTAEQYQALKPSNNIILPPVSEDKLRVNKGLDRWGTSVLLNSAPKMTRKAPPATAAT